MTYLMCGLILAQWLAWFIYAKINVINGSGYISCLNKNCFKPNMVNSC